MKVLDLLEKEQTRLWAVHLAAIGPIADAIYWWHELNTFTSLQNKQWRSQKHEMMKKVQTP